MERTPSFCVVPPSESTKRLWPSRTACSLPALRIEPESSIRRVASTTSLAFTSSTDTPSAALMAVPMSLIWMACRALAESEPCAIALSKRLSSPLLDMTHSFRLEDEIRPAIERVGALHHVHAGIGEALESRLRVAGEVGIEAARGILDRHGGHAVLHDVDLARERRIVRQNLVE